MLENTIARKKRRLIILEGISQDLKHSEISAQLGANRWLIMSDIKFMQNNGDLGLEQAEKAQSTGPRKESFTINKGEDTL